MSLPAGPVVPAILVAAVAVACTANLFGGAPRRSLLGLWWLLLFQRTIAGAAGIDTAVGTAIVRADDVVLALLFVLTITAQVRGKWLLPRRMAGVWLGAGGFVLSGMVSSWLGSVPLETAVVGGWLASKFWVILYVTLSVPGRDRDRIDPRRAIVLAGTIVTAVAAVELVAPSALRSLLGDASVEYRAGLPSLRSFFVHPGRMAIFMATAATVVLVAALVRRGSGYLTGLAFLLTACLSLRIKPVLGIAAALAVAVLVQPSSLGKKGSSGNKSAMAMVGLFVSIFFAASPLGQNLETQLNRYSGEATPRAALYSAGWAISRDHFPLGVGFGRFGSEMSLDPYSDVYDRYDLSSIWGLSRSYPAFLTDTSWPSLIGESGQLGALCYLGALAALTAWLLRRARATVDDRGSALIALGALIVFVVDSIGDPFLFDSLSGLTVALLVGAVLWGTTDSADAAAEAPTDELLAVGAAGRGGA